MADSEGLDGSNGIQFLRTMCNVIWIFKKCTSSELDNIVSFADKKRSELTASMLIDAERLERLKSKNPKNRAEQQELRKLREENEKRQKVLNGFEAAYSTFLEMKKNEVVDDSVWNKLGNDTEGDETFARIKKTLQALFGGNQNEAQFELNKKTLTSETNAVISLYRLQSAALRLKVASFSYVGQSLLKMPPAERTQEIQDVMAQISENQEHFDSLKQLLDLCETLAPRLEDELEKVISLADFRYPNRKEMASFGILEDVVKLEKAPEKLGNSEASEGVVKLDPKVLKDSEGVVKAPEGSELTPSQKKAKKAAKKRAKTKEKKAARKLANEAKQDSEDVGEEDSESEQCPEFAKVVDMALDFIETMVNRAQMEDDVKIAEGVVELDSEDEDVVKDSKSEDSKNLEDIFKNYDPGFAVVHRAYDLIAKYRDLEMLKPDFGVLKAWTDIQNEENHGVPEKLSKALGSLLGKNAKEVKVLKATITRECQQMITECLRSAGTSNVAYSLWEQKDDIKEITETDDSEKSEIIKKLAETWQECAAEIEKNEHNFRLLREFRKLEEEFCKLLDSQDGCESAHSSSGESESEESDSEDDEEERAKSRKLFFEDSKDVKDTGDEESQKVFVRMWKAIELMVNYRFLEIRRHQKHYNELLEKAHTVQDLLKHRPPIPLKKTTIQQIVKQIITELEEQMNRLNILGREVDVVFGEFPSQYFDGDEELEKIARPLNALSNSENVAQEEELKNTINLETSRLIHAIQAQDLSFPLQISIMKSQLADIRKCKKPGNSEKSEKEQFLERVIEWSSHEDMSGVYRCMNVIKMRQLEYLRLVEERASGSGFQKIPVALDNLLEVLKKPRVSEDVKDSEDQTKFVVKKLWTLIAGGDLYERTFYDVQKTLLPKNLQRISEIKSLLTLIPIKREATKKRFGFFKTKAERLLEQSTLEDLDEKESELQELLEGYEEIISEFAKVFDNPDYGRQDEERTRNAQENHDEQDLKKIKDAVRELFSGGEIDAEALKRTISSETDRLISDLIPFQSEHECVSKCVKTIKENQNHLLDIYEAVRRMDATLEDLAEMRVELEKLDSEDVEKEDSDEMKAYMAHVFGDSSEVEEDAPESDTEDVDLAKLILIAMGEDNNIRDIGVLGAVFKHCLFQQKSGIPERIADAEGSLQMVRDQQSQVLEQRKALKEKGTASLSEEDEETLKTLEEREAQCVEAIENIEGTIRVLKEMKKEGEHEKCELEMEMILQDLAIQDYDVVVSKCKSQLSKLKKQVTPIIQNLDGMQDVLNENKGQDLTELKENVKTYRDCFKIFQSFPGMVEEFLETWKEKREAILKKINSEFDASKDVKDSKVEDLESEDDEDCEEVETPEVPENVDSSTSKTEDVKNSESEKLDSHDVKTPELLENTTLKNPESQIPENSVNSKIHKKAVPKNPDSTDYVGYYGAGEFNEFMARRQEQNPQTVLQVEKFLVFAGLMTVFFIGMYLIFAIVLWFYRFF